MSPWLAETTVGIGDCEAMRDGFIHQPANATSSLAFLLAAAWIAWRAAEVRPERAELFVLAACVAANGIGSFGFHGPFGASFRWFHDLSALSIPLFVAVHDAGLVRGTAIRTRLAGVATGVAIVGALLAAWPHLLVPLGFVGAVAAGLGELAAFRAGYRPRPGHASGVQLAAWGVVLGALALAGLAFLLGRSTSPWCRPESLLQAHAAWHLLVAVGSVAYAWAAFELRGEPPT
ncbi:MAG: hypothetical protein ACXWYQ_09670 [Actinomycetota bacterium]